VGALGHYLEAAGIPTTGISLVRENTVRIRPPRALWVPFDLGRPFGAPNEPAFQSEVLRAALALLARDDGPVILEDFPKDAPGQGEAGMEGMACPIPLRRPATRDPFGMREQVMSEINQLAPWREVFLAKRGHSIVGVSKMSIDEAVTALVSILETGRVDGLPDDELGFCLRYASEDLRNWYIEAASARPGGAASARQLADWFWGETSAGALILALHPACLASGNPQLKRIAARALVPRAQHRRLAAQTHGDRV
jgi:hypothetical protein